MKLIKRGSVFVLDYTVHGTRKRVSTGETDETRAYIKAADMVAKLANVSIPQLAGTLGELLEDTYRARWERTRSGKVMATIVEVLKRELGSLPIAEVTTKVLRSHCERWLESGTAPATINRRMSAISVALNRAAEDGAITAVPKLPHYRENNVKERYMTVEEERAVLEWLSRQSAAVEALGRPGEYAYVRNAAVFLLDTGFRFSELFKFTVVDGHADLKHGTTKTDAGRRVPLTDRALVAAQHLLASPVHARLKALRSERAAWDWVSHRFAQATKAAGCGDVTLHILRHTCASRLVQRGVPIFTVSKWLGHSSVKVTERYAKLAPDSLAEALAALTRKAA